MADTSRMLDEWCGQCCCHSDPTCIAMTGYIIEGLTTVITGGQDQALLLHETIGHCGHTGRIVTSSSTVSGGGKGKARIGDEVTGCNIGNIITGTATVQTGG
jgi:uncharacterized Zn-binding protein involved in type VI secretion